jgi:hypothetical protein
MMHFNTTVGANSLLSLTPRFSGVCEGSEWKETVSTVSFVGCADNMNETYVSSRLFAGLVAHSVGNFGTPSAANQARGSKAVRVPLRLRKGKGYSHENQLCECRPRSRSHRFANEFSHSGHDAIVKGQFFALDKRTESDPREIRLGTRLRRVFGFRIGNAGRVKLHCGSGRTSSKAKLYGRIGTICNTARLAMATRLKPLKRFQHTTEPGTPLKRGVMEKPGRKSGWNTQIVT